MSNVKVIEKNEGKKIEFEQQGTKLYFGDDELMLNAAKYQKEWPVSVDICRDKSGNLTIGAENGIKYVAQVDIPGIEYEESEEEEDKVLEPVPLDMAEVTVTLWSIE